MTPRTWSHAVHDWHMPHLLRPGLGRAPRLHLTRRQIEAIRKGIIVLLCALLAGGLGVLLRDSGVGPLSPASIAGASRA